MLILHGIDERDVMHTFHAIPCLFRTIPLMHRLYFIFVALYLNKNALIRWMDMIPSTPIITRLSEMANYDLKRHLSLRLLYGYRVYPKKTAFFYCHMCDTLTRTPQKHISKCPSLNARRNALNRLNARLYGYNDSRLVDTPLACERCLSTGYIPKWFKSGHQFRGLHLECCDCSEEVSMKEASLGCFKCGVVCKRCTI